MGDVVSFPAKVNEVDALLDEMKSISGDLAAVFVLARTKDGGLVYRYTPLSAIDISVFCKKLDQISYNIFEEDDIMAEGVDEPPSAS